MEKSNFVFIDLRLVIISLLGTKLLCFRHPCTNNLGIFYGKKSLSLCKITKKQYICRQKALLRSANIKIL